MSWLILRFVMGVVAIAVSEKAPTPLVLTPATLTLYCLPASRSINVVKVTSWSSWVSLDESSPVRESSRIQLVMGVVVFGVMFGDYIIGRKWR